MEFSSDFDLRAYWLSGLRAAGFRFRSKGLGLSGLRAEGLREAFMGSGFRVFGVSGLMFRLTASASGFAVEVGFRA